MDPRPSADEDRLRALGALIKRARKDVLGLSREAFAARMDCSPLTLDKIECGSPGVGLGHVMAALRTIGAADVLIESIERSVSMLELAAKPVSFPAP
jgi:transcriptional regulator with XRE-family HTH domain